MCNPKKTFQRIEEKNPLKQGLKHDGPGPGVPPDGD